MAGSKPASLLGAPVSTGFVARALERFAQRLAAGGFDEAMTEALRAENVLCGDETPPSPETSPYPGRTTM